LEIFNFFRKFGSNLQNECSGSSVIIQKFNSTSLFAAGTTRGGVTAERFCAAFPHAGTSPSPWRLRRALSQPGELIPAINSHSRRRRSHFFPSALLHHRVAPPLAVVLVEPRQSFPATST